MNHSELYALRLWDYAIPSFVSGDTCYYGTREMILTFLKKEKRYQRLLEAAREYFSGTGDGAVSLFGEVASPVLRRVEFLASRGYTEENLSFQFVNIWDFASDISIRRLKARLVYIRDGDHIRRLAKVIAEHMTKQREWGEFRYWEHRPWGLPGFITKTGEDGLCSALFYADRAFSDEEELRSDLERPQSVDLTRFLLEVHGDG